MDATDFFNYPTNDADDLVAVREEPFLGSCSLAEWELIREHGDIVRFAAGGAVIAPGSPSRELLVVLGGSVEVVIFAGRRGRHRLAVLGVGSVLGELAFLDGKPADANVLAREETTFLRLTVEQFDRLAASNPRLGLYLLFDVGRVLAGRLRRLEGPTAIT